MLEARLAERRGTGAPLPHDTRSFMEQRFGVDFNKVRGHADPEAGQISRKLGAQAFTHGQDIYLGAGRYELGADAGKRLLAHELTHTIQQAGVPRVQRNGFGKAYVPPKIKTVAGTKGGKIPGRAGGAEAQPELWEQARALPQAQKARSDPRRRLVPGWCTRRLATYSRLPAAVHASRPACPIG